MYKFVDIIGNIQITRKLDTICFTIGKLLVNVNIYFFISDLINLL